MNDKTTYSLDELSDLTGLSTRSIRHYIQQGLLSGAESRGRNAWYTDEHLNRLRCLQILRDRSGLSLNQLRPVINSLSEEQIRAIGTGEEEVIAMPVGDTSSLMPNFENQIETAKNLTDQSLNLTEKSLSAVSSVLEESSKNAPSNDALDYIRQIRGSKPGDLSRLAAMVQSIEKLTDGRRIRRQAKNEWWSTVKVTPDIEIRARGLDEKDVGELERLADLLRHLIMKGDK